jgi:hypothetical protein
MGSYHRDAGGLGVRAGDRIAARPVRHHGDRPARPRHLLSLADRCDRHHSRGILDGDLLRRYSGRLAAHPGDTGLGRLCRRSLCHDAQGRGRTGARRRRLVFRGRRHRRHALADDPGAAARRNRAVVLDLRIFLARLPRPDVRHAGGALFSGEGDRRDVHRSAGLVHRDRKSRRRAAIHLWTDRPVRWHRTDPGAGRRVCRGASDARDADAGAAAAPQAQIRKHHGGPVEGLQKSITGR